MQKIHDMISKPALFEQLAEEATELAHAALKYARILREENPTPVTPEEGYAKIIEEYSDLIQCSRILDIPTDEEQIEVKYHRWVKRRLEQLAEGV